MKHFSLNIPVEIDENITSLVPNIKRLYLNLCNYYTDLSAWSKCTHVKFLSIVSYDDKQSLPISGVDLYSLQRFSNLNDLKISLYNINLSDDVFKYLPNLQSIRLFCSYLVGLDKSQLSCLKNLKCFHLNVKKLIDREDLPQSADVLKTIINKLTSLEVLSLSNINIGEVDSDLIGNLTNLKDLSVRNCNINKIADGTFSNLKNLKKIDFNEIDFYD